MAAASRPLRSGGPREIPLHDRDRRIRPHLLEPLRRPHAAVERRQIDHDCRIGRRAQTGRRRGTDAQALIYVNATRSWRPSAGHDGERVARPVWSKHSVHWPGDARRAHDCDALARQTLQPRPRPRVVLTAVAARPPRPRLTLAAALAPPRP